VLADGFTGVGLAGSALEQGSGFIGAVRAVWVGAAGRRVRALGFTGSVCTTWHADAGWIFATSAGDRVPPSAGSSLAAP
jgi:hypothetical protein